MPITLNHNGDIAVTNGTITIDGSPVGGGGGGGGFTFYDVTLSDVENVNSQTAVARITVPGGTWASGQYIVLDLGCEIANFTGSSTLPMVTAKLGIYNVFDQYGSWPAYSASRVFIRTIFFRNGDDVYVCGNTSFNNYGFAFPLDVSGIAYPPFALGTNAIKTESIYNFSSDLQLGLDLNPGTADPSIYLRPFNGTAYKTEKGTPL